MAESNTDCLTQASSSGDECRDKRRKPIIYSQISNVSFNSVGGNDSSSGSSASSTTTFPRVSLRAILMNSPFARRTKPRRAATRNRSANSGCESESNLPSGVLVSPSSSRSDGSPGQKSSCTKISSRTGSGSSIRRCTVRTRGTGSNAKTVLVHITPEPTETGPNGERVKECPLCVQETNLSLFPVLSTCDHLSCLSCMQRYLTVEITESRINITCPQCSQLMHPTDVHNILKDPILSSKFEDFMLRRVLSMDPDTRWCPAPDCGYAVVASGCASCPELKCERPGCGSSFCYHCKAEWHPDQTCDVARSTRSLRAPNLWSSSPFMLEYTRKEDEIKACPRCNVLIVKLNDGSCNHMTCSVCFAEFCWLCMKEISDLHYLSPSGCTFWGKKPWSRKKKILWQLGTLIGAPVGIALVAGLAIPAMIIGIPIWVGKKIHSRYSVMNGRRRNFAVVGGVTLSTLVSPVLAGMAVTIGVPILLAYVYGVVPVSLCRSGGCGVTTSASGVRIAFDDENEVVIGIPGRMTGDAGQASGGGSASQSDNCFLNMNRTHINPDSGSATNAERLEVHADIAAGSRSLASIDTTSLATSEKSNHTLDMENASMRALAGSILHYKLNNDAERHSNASTRANEDSVSAVVDAMSQGSNPVNQAQSHCLPTAALTMVPGFGGDSGDASGLYGGNVDSMRLDSVSAIITARQMSASVAAAAGAGARGGGGNSLKGVTFGSSSMDRLSMDHVILPIDDEEYFDGGDAASLRLLYDTVPPSASLTVAAGDADARCCVESASHSEVLDGWLVSQPLLCRRYPSVSSRRRHHGTQRLKRSKSNVSRLSRYAKPQRSKSHPQLDSI